MTPLVAIITFLKQQHAALYQMYECVGLCMCQVVFVCLLTVLHQQQRVG